MNRAVNIVLLLFWFWVFSASCAAFRAPARTADDAAQVICAAHEAKRQGVSVDQALDQFCKTEAQLRPWLELVLSAEREGVKGGCK